MKRPGVKICGVTRVEDARLAVEMGAELIGLNFWPQSPRFLSLEAARPIVEEIVGQARSVGVWVNPTRREVTALDEDLSLDLLQFHGDQDPAAVDWFPDRVIKAIRVGPDLDTDRLGEYPRAWGFLFDCAPSGVYGGTGISWSYERIAELQSSKPVLLAGGLDPDNVGAAVVESGADFVDVCSGVEAAPGIKDPDLLQRFIREVRNVQTRD